MPRHLPSPTLTNTSALKSSVFIRVASLLTSSVNLISDIEAIGITYSYASINVFR